MDSEKLSKDQVFLKHTEPIMLPFLDFEQLKSKKNLTRGRLKEKQYR